ncbi:hypothetical protein [Streptomyces sp. NA04227]|uniref:hypothetical protein n=1 Tax=Streptomyces sp. NA04227 TaxID=2742136 RepID=UPI0020CA3C1D|nr:hypothetical protein [Streptomyces sp. NA04227]
MHMNSVPQHLMNEDRLAYERALDEALHSASNEPGATAATERRLNSEQLRTMALSATALITAAAATEYERYVRTRAELRNPAPLGSAASATVGTGPSGAANGLGEEADSGSGTTTGLSGESAGSASGGSRGNGSRDGSAPESVQGIDATGNLAAGAVEVVEGASAGVFAVIAVLAPMLAGAAAVIFLLVGYLLRAVSPGTAFATTMVATGWAFAVLTALAILIAATGLLLTALRNSAASMPAARAERAKLAEVERARQDWLDALTERGIRPFLAEALARPATAGTPVPHPSEPGQRMPQLGYHRPGFSSPNDGDRGPNRPRYSSPHYSSPDFGGSRAASGTSGSGAAGSGTAADSGAGAGRDGTAPGRRGALGDANSP